MFIRLTYFTLQPEKKSDIIKMYYTEIAPVIKEQPGLIAVMLLEPVEEGGEFISCTTWKSEADIKAFEVSHSYPEVFGKIKAATTKPPYQKYYNAESM